MWVFIAFYFIYIRIGTLRFQFKTMKLDGNKLRLELRGSRLSHCCSGMGSPCPLATREKNTFYIPEHHNAPTQKRTS